MSKELECPNCGCWNEEPDECYEQDEIYFCECEECDKTFGFTISYIKHFSEFVTPCQNEGGEHDWKPVRGAPEKYFVGRYRCSYCDEEKTVEDELIKDWD